MSDVIDLSTLKKPRPETKGPHFVPEEPTERYDTLSDEDREALQRMAEESGTEAPEEVEDEEPKDVYETAFLVLKADDGTTVSTPDIDLVNRIQTRRPPTRDEVYGMAGILVRDVQALVSAEMAAQAIQQMSQAQMQKMQQAQQEAQIRAQMATQGGPRGR